MVTPAHQMMLDDGLPPCAIMTPAARLAAWHNKQITSTPFSDPRIEQDRQLRAKQKEQATQERIDALRQSKGLNPIYNTAINSNQPQENDMPKFVIKPLDQHGSPVIRGMTSVKDTATPEQIDAQVQQAIKRGGKKVAVVLLCGADRQPQQAWTVAEGVVASTDVAPYLLAADQLVAASSPATEAQPDADVADQGEESEMAKKTKKPAKAKAEKGYKGHRAGSRKEKAHKLYDELGPEKAKPKVIAMGIKAGSVNGWFSSFKK